MKEIVLYFTLMCNNYAGILGHIPKSSHQASQLHKKLSALLDKIFNS